MASLGGGGLVTLYTVKDTRYACLPSWNEHQKISHPTPSSLPGCDAPGAVLESPEGHFQRIRQNPPPIARSGGLRNAPEDSGGLQNAPERSGASARARADRIGSDRKDRIGGEASHNEGAGGLGRRLRARGRRVARPPRLSDS